MTKYRYRAGLPVPVPVLFKESTAGTGTSAQKVPSVKVPPAIFPPVKGLGYYARLDNNIRLFSLVIIAFSSFSTSCCFFLASCESERYREVEINPLLTVIAVALVSPELGKT